MVKRKASKVPTRAKPIKPDITIVDIEDQNIENVSLEKRLADFDRQVEIRISQMEQDRDGLISKIQSLYFVDAQKTPRSVNEMLWINFLKGDCQGKSQVRESICALAEIAETQLLVRGKKATALKSTAKNTRQKKIVFGESQLDNFPVPEATVRGPRSKRVMELTAGTPWNQGIPQYLEPFTPKFDPRLPLPPGTVKRPPKPGELVVGAMSMTGSPLIEKGSKEWLESLAKETLDEATKQELRTIQAKVAEILHN